MVRLLYKTVVVCALCTPGTEQALHKIVLRRNYKWVWDEHMAKGNRMISETNRLGNKTRNNILDAGK